MTGEEGVFELREGICVVVAERGRSMIGSRAAMRTMALALDAVLHRPVLRSRLT